MSTNLLIYVFYFFFHFWFDFSLSIEGEYLTLPRRTIQVGYAISDPQDSRAVKVRALRREIGEFLHHLVNFFERKKEDDTENICVLIKVTYDTSFLLCFLIPVHFILRF